MIFIYSKLSRKTAKNRLVDTHKKEKWKIDWMGAPFIYFFSTFASFAGHESGMFRDKLCIKIDHFFTLSLTRTLFLLCMSVCVGAVVFGSFFFFLISKVGVNFMGWKRKILHYKWHLKMKTCVGQQPWTVYSIHDRVLCTVCNGRIFVLMYDNWSTHDVCASNSKSLCEWYTWPNDKLYPVANDTSSARVRRMRNCTRDRSGEWAVLFFISFAFIIICSLSFHLRQ